MTRMLLIIMNTKHYAYYNEIDPNAAAWIRELIKSGAIMPGTVDERSIADVSASDLRGFTRCHFFAGIAGWELALQLAGWPEDRPVWTGSAPCQSFSVAGKGRGTDDERHLWPELMRLIRECRPVQCFGEQVENAVRHGWLDGISTDLEGEGYACGAAVLGAHSAGAPHIRQRLYWVANAAGQQYDGGGNARGGRGESSDGGADSRLANTASPRRDGPEPGTEGDPRHEARMFLPGSNSTDSRLAHGISPGLEGHGGDVHHGSESGRVTADPAGSTAAGGHTGDGVADVTGDGRHQEREDGSGGDEGTGAEGRPPGSGLRGTDHWSDAIWIPCRDGKHRRISAIPSLFPLSDGLPYRVAPRGSVRAPLLKGAGNAIVPQTAAIFIQAFLTTP